jgi:hypothetical protein
MSGGTLDEDPPVHGPPSAVSSPPSAVIPNGVSEVRNPSQLLVAEEKANHLPILRQIV